LVYNKDLRKGMFVSVVCELNPKGQRKIVWNFSSNFKMLMSSAVPKKCISSLWEQGVNTCLSCGMMG